MLTRKQFELLRFIHERLTESGVPPSFDEMKDALDLRSKSGIHRLITALEERGFIRRLANRARDELSRSGARLIREPVSGVEALTPSEVRVAELAAEGLTNREVAQALFVSEKTVETHLGRVYRKLDIKSRHALPGALADRQAAEPVA